MVVEIIVVLDDGTVEDFSSATSALQFIADNEYFDNEVIGFDAMGEPWHVPMSVLETLVEQETEQAQRAEAERKAIHALSSKVAGG